MTDQNDASDRTPENGQQEPTPLPASPREGGTAGSPDEANVPAPSTTPDPEGSETQPSRDGDDLFDREPAVEADPRDADSVFEPYARPQSLRDFGELLSEIHDDLRKHRLVFLQSTDEVQLTELSNSLVGRYWRGPEKVWTVYTHSSEPNKRAPDSIPQALREMHQSSAGALVVFFDVHSGYDSLLYSASMETQRAAQLLTDISRAQLYVVVLTRPERFQKLVTIYGGYQLEARGRVIAPRPDHANGRPIDAGVLEEIRRTLGHPGLLTAWALAWFSEAPFDTVFGALERMVAHTRQDEERREEVLEAWRTQFNEVLTKVGAEWVQDARVGVRLQLGDANQSALQQIFRLHLRVHHLEAMTLLRNSGVLEQADWHFLLALSSVFARLAILEPQSGRRVLVTLRADWLDAVSIDRRRFLLAATFFSLVRSGELALASTALTSLSQSGHADSTRDVLVRCSPEQMREPWFLQLLNSTLPGLTEAHRRALWSRIIRASAADGVDLDDVVRSMHAHLSAWLFAEYVGRFAEEALLGARARSRRMLALMPAAPRDPESGAGRLAETLRSEAFRHYSEHQADKWLARGSRHPLFDTWILRTLAPIVPEVPIVRLLGLLGRAMYDEVPYRVPAKFRAPSPADQIVALLLTDCCSTLADADTPVDVPNVTGMVQTLVPDQEAAAAIDETLRVLADRFLRACRVAALLQPDVDLLDLNAQTAIRRFFTAKATVVEQLRRALQRLYFKGASRDHA